MDSQTERKQNFVWPSLLFHWLPTRMSAFPPVTHRLHKYVAEQVWEKAHFKIYSDGSVIVSRLQDDETSHSCSRRRLCELVSCLQLNISKTKDMIVDFRRRAHTHEPLCNHLWKSNLRPFAGIGAAPVSYLACCWIRAQCHSDSEAVAESADLLIASWGTDGAVIRVIMKSDHLPLSVQTYHLVSKFKTRGLMFRLHP